MQTRGILVLGLTLVVAWATGCGQETSNAPTAAEFTKERQALAARKANGKAAPEAVAAVDKGKGPAKGKPAGPGGANTAYATGGRDYFYDPTGKRDPFRSFQFEDEGKQDKKSFGPLADFELGQLELSAVIWDAKNPRALILDPGGRSYIVREGSQIGKNNGEVVQIGDNLVLVKETYVNFAGEQTSKDVELRIRLSQGG
jgi:type IV pilus assembly protein PilP